MAQHDYDIASGTGAAVRADINNALSAIVTLNSGTTEPSDTFPYQLWADTTTGLLKVRNAGDTAWVPIGTMATDYLGLTLKTYTDARLPNDFIAGLLCVNNSTRKWDIDAYAVMLLYGSDYYLARSVNLTVDLETSGANGLDTGSIASSTPYFFFVIGKADGTIAGLASLSSSSPTMPSGYVYKKLVSWCRTDGSSNLYKAVQVNKRFFYLDLITVANGTTAQNWVDVNFSTYMPSAWGYRVMAALEGQASVGDGWFLLRKNGHSGTAGQFGFYMPGTAGFRMAMSGEVDVDASAYAEVYVQQNDYWYVRMFGFEMY